MSDSLDVRGLPRRNDLGDPSPLLDAQIRNRFEVRNFANEAAEVIRGLIFARRFRPGERLNESDLSQMLRISRSPIREALKALAGEGLIEFIPRRGAFVADFTVEKVEQLGEVRQALECLAAGLAAERASDGQLAELAQLIDRTESCLRAEPDAYPSDLDFHLQVLAMSHNAPLVQSASGVINQLQLARAWSARTPGRAMEACQEHRMIHDALSRRDVNAATAAMRVHLEQATQNARDLLSMPSNVATRVAGATK